MKTGPNGPEPDLTRFLAGHPADFQLPPPDLKAIFAYLRSVPSISNRVPDPLGPDGKTLGFE